MAEVLVDSNTKWKCLLCGKCCRDIGKGLGNSKLILDKSSGRCSKLNEKNLCSDYFRRPVICMMYPFHPSREKLALGVVDFSIGKLLIDPGCPGFGYGINVVGNELLMKELKKVALLLEHRMNLIRNGKIVDAFFEK